MVGILLMILKVLGIILLALISLLLLIVVIVLFVPIKYEAQGDKEDKYTASVHVFWLLKAFKIELLYDVGIKYRVKILWKVIMQAGYEKERHNKKKSKKDNKLVIPSHVRSKEKGNIRDKQSLEDKQLIPDNKAIDNEQLINEKSEDESIIKSRLFQNESQNKGNINDSYNSKKENIKDHKKKLKVKDKKTNKGKQNNTLSQGKDILKKIRDFYKDESYHGVIKFVWRHFYKVIKSILPKRTKIELEYGLNDPMMTGLSLGIISIFYSVLGNSMVIKPDFNQQMVKGKAYVKGRIYLFIIAYHAIIVIMDKRVKKLIAELKK